MTKSLLASLECGPSNPSSLHASGRQAQFQLEQASERIASCVGGRFDQPGGPRLIFTSGGTESNNLALRGIAAAGPLVVSRIEHPSVLGPAEMLEKQGRKIFWLDSDERGMVRLDQLASFLHLDSRPYESPTPASNVNGFPNADSSPTGDGDSVSPGIALVSVMSANNETGVIQPTDQVASLCKQAGVPLHVDATQTIGKLPFDLEACGASAVSFSAHKFHGPAGAGGLWLAAGMGIEPILFGGEQQLESRPGTEPVALIVAMAEALRLATVEAEESIARCKRLRDRLELALLEQFPDLVIQGHDSPRLPGTSCISFVGTDRQSMLMALDMAGIECSSGSACSSGSSPPSHVLIAMGRAETEIQSALRFGVSKFSTDQEIDTAIDSISRIYKRLRR